MTHPRVEGFSVSYGELQQMLATLCGISPATVQARFRNLRLRDFPDAIRHGKGVRVSYDLPRILAFCAVFALGDCALPQLNAAELVQATWPEWCRAFIAAGARSELPGAPRLLPADATTIISISPDGFASGSRMLAVATNDGTIAPSGSPLACTVQLDVATILKSLSALPVDVDGLVRATNDLSDRFGWDRGEVPHRDVVAKMPPSRGFLDDGPYFERASALLGEVPGESISGTRSWRLKVLSDYLQRPAPVDAWKAQVGDDENSPRLHHLLTVHARSLGIDTFHVDPDTFAACAPLDVRAAARDMIDRARSQRGLAQHD